MNKENYIGIMFSGVLPTKIFNKGDFNVGMVPVTVRDEDKEFNKPMLIQSKSDCRLHAPQHSKETPPPPPHQQLKSEPPQRTSM